MSVKVKVICSTPLTSRRRAGAQLYSFFNLGAKCGWDCQRQASAVLTPGKNTRRDWVRSGGGGAQPSDGYGKEKMYRPQTGSEPRAVQPVARCYTDYAVPASEHGKVVSPTHRPPLPTRKNFWYSFLLDAAAGRIKWTKSLIDLVGNRTRGRPACGAVPQPTVPPRTPTDLFSAKSDKKCGETDFHKIMLPQWHCVETCFKFDPKSAKKCGNYSNNFIYVLNNSNTKTQKIRQAVSS